MDAYTCWLAGEGIIATPVGVRVCVRVGEGAGGGYRGRVCVRVWAEGVHEGVCEGVGERVYEGVGGGGGRRHMHNLYVKSQIAGDTITCKCKPCLLSN